MADNHSRQAILKRAFEGKLVSRDPSDEPASVLLERIRTERAAQDVNGMSRRRKRTAEPSLPLPLTYGIGSPCRDDR
jgi:type I restriction enzyme S subunit